MEFYDMYTNKQKKKKKSATRENNTSPERTEIEK
jgi:hypothetical protein